MGMNYLILSACIKSYRGDNYFSSLILFVSLLHDRINKKGSQKDQEQKRSGNYFFYDDGADDDDVDDDDI
jgi:hypothetical protein